MASHRISYTWSLALEFSNLNIKCHQGNSDNGPGKKRVRGRGGREKWGLKSTMANKSHQMTKPDSHFNSGMIPLCHVVLSSIDFLPLLLGHRKAKKWLLLLLAPELRLPTIKVNVGTTLFTMSRSSSSARRLIHPQPGHHNQLAASTSSPANLFPLQKHCPPLATSVCV